MNKKELENEIIKTQEQLKKLQETLKKAEKEVPETLEFAEDDVYCYVDETGNICWTKYTHISEFDADLIHNHRAFPTERLANIFADKTQFIAYMLHFKCIYDRDYEPNWDSEDEVKYCIYYNTRTKKFGWSDRINCMNMECVYFSTQQLAERCAEWLNKRVKENA